MEHKTMTRLLLIAAVMLLIIAIFQFFTNHALKKRNDRQAMTILRQRDEIIDLKKQQQIQMLFIDSAVVSGFDLPEYQPDSIILKIGKSTQTVRKGDYVYWKLKRDQYYESEFILHKVYDISRNPSGKVFLELGHSKGFTDNMCLSDIILYKKY
jgi:hypothetical protein